MHRASFCIDQVVAGQWGAGVASAQLWPEVADEECDDDGATVLMLTTTVTDGNMGNVLLLR